MYVCVYMYVYVYVYIYIYIYTYIQIHAHTQREGAPGRRLRQDAQGGEPRGAHVDAFLCLMMINTLNDNKQNDHDDNNNDNNDITINSTSSSNDEHRHTHNSTCAHIPRGARAPSYLYVYVCHYYY